MCAPSLASFSLVTLPTPGKRPTGNGSRNASISWGWITKSPSGLRQSEASLAKSLFGATPAEAVRFRTLFAWAFKSPVAQVSFGLATRFRQAVFHLSGFACFTINRGTFNRRTFNSEQGHGKRAEKMESRRKAKKVIAVAVPEDNRCVAMASCPMARRFPMGTDGPLPATGSRREPASRHLPHPPSWAIPYGTQHPVGELSQRNTPQANPACVSMGNPSLTLSRGAFSEGIVSEFPE